MFEYPFKFEVQFLDEFFHAIENYWKNHPELIKLPNKNHLKQLIEISTFASIGKEESRSISFTLTYESINNDSFSCIFKNPLPFNIDNLIKLAPALMNTSYSIGVAIDENDRFFIWGFTLLPSHLRVFAIEPMKIIIHCYQVDAIITGSKAFLIGNKFSFLNSLIWNKGRRKNQTLSVTNQTYIDIIGNLMIAVRKIAHGGTVLIVPNNNQWKESIKEPIKFELVPSHNIVKMDIETILKINSSIEKASSQKVSPSVNKKYDECWKSLVNSLGYIASLTAVDGAMILSYDFEVLAFGAKIKAKNTTNLPLFIRYVEPIEGSQPYSKEFTDIGGTRHQSAAQFVFDQKDAIAIVASQDGKLTIFSWDPIIHEIAAFTNAEYWFLSKILFGWI